MMAKRPESAMADPLRHMLEAVIADGAVAAVLIWETADGRIGVRSEPHLLSVQRGLIGLASWEPKGEEE